MNEPLLLSEGVVLQDLVRSYGATSVISKLNMTVDRGSIYGLLGPSGCGKTTLLKLILGRLVPDHGVIRVLGRPPHSPDHYVPGYRIGYAPQETALYSDLTIKETFLFHGRMQGMNDTQIEERSVFLSDFLELPPSSRMVGRLSGGQKRRVSLAVALLHNPELLLLDEPTVGVDPLLRLRIWNHLRDIASTGVTIVITTHYIEEARQAHKVGLMRGGRLLAQGQPDHLMSSYGHTTLEGVFLDLCRGTSPQNLNIESNIAVESSFISNSENTHLDDRDKYKSVLDIQTKKSGLIRTGLQIVSLVIRKLTQLVRNPLVLFFEIMVPTIQIFLFMTCIGPTPTQLPFAVINQDNGTVFANRHVNLGLEVLNFLKESNELKLYTTYDIDTAISKVKLGEIWGTLIIPENFTHSLIQKVFDQNYPLSYGSLYLDLSNYQVSLIIQQQLTNALEETVKDLMHTNQSAIQLKPIYGNDNTKFSTFLAPGIVTVIAFAHSIGITAIAFVREKSDGTIDRIFAAGVKSTTIILGHFTTHSIILLVQTTIMICVAIFGFKIPVVGSILNVFIMLLVLGWVGMSFGLLISTIAKQETEAVMLALASFFPALLLSGVLWPLEAIPNWFSWLSYSLPTTHVATAARSIMIRGWGMSHKEVWLGYVVSFAWSFVFILSASLKLQTIDKQWFWHRNKSSKDATSVQDQHQINLTD